MSPARAYRVALCIVLGFCLLHMAGVMSYLLREGRLSIVPIYDDVSYLVDGLNRLAVLDQRGLPGFLRDYVFTHPPHAPFVALTGVAGLLLSAGAAWGPYLMSIVWLVAVMLLGWVALRHSSPGTRAGILIASLAVPMFGFLVAEFRPDPVWGLLVGFCVVLAASANVLGLGAGKLFALGLLFGTAIVFKPTAAPAAAAVLAAAWVVQLGVSLLMVRARKRALWASAWVAFGAACVVIPYLLTNGAAILAYVREVMAGSSMWRTPGSAWVHMTYYLNRAVGTTVLGWAWYAALPLFAACAALIAWSRDRSALPGLAAVLVAVVTAYVIVTASAVKSLMIGSLLYGAIIAAVVWCLGYLAWRIQLGGHLVIVLGALAFAIFWVPRTGQVHRGDPNMLAADVANRAILPALVEVLRDRPAASVLVTVPGPAYAGTLEFLTKQQGVPRTVRSGYTTDSWERVQQTVAASDVIVLSEVGMVGQSLGWTFPSLQFQMRLLDELRSGSEFSGNKAFTDAQGRSVWLFVRKAK